MRSPVLRLFTLIGGCLLTLSCADAPDVTGPASVDGQAASRLLLPAPTQYNVVTRNVPLATAETGSRTVGLLGGTITLPVSGLTVVVPPFAVTQSTVITVTAVPGQLLAYEFQPHGQQFMVPLIVRQNLTGTSAYQGGVLPSVLYAGYFANVLDLDQLAGTAMITELLGTSISVWNTSVSFPVFHFSGWLIGTGESGSGEEGGAQQQ
jgi:hypothetical protein